MPARAQLLTLLAEIERSRAVLARIDTFYLDYLRQTDQVAARTQEQAIVLADVIVSYYTALETIFLRISQFFENSFDPDKWHQDLLHKMTLRVESIREPVLGDATVQALFELLKFRHFKRYYFEFQYDWDRLDYLKQRFAAARPKVVDDLDAFDAFLRRLLAAAP
jgi:hypothetical protein